MKLDAAAGSQVALGRGAGAPFVFGDFHAHEDVEEFTLDGG
jgi:hypothetical protein